MASEAQHQQHQHQHQQQQQHEARRFLLAIDQGTSSTRAAVYDAHDVSLVAMHQVQFDCLTPRPGWVEQDPVAVLGTVTTCITRAVAAFTAKTKLPASSIVAAGLTNQRETTVAWRRSTGKPLHNAIVWLDTRTADLVGQMTQRLGGDQQALRAATGLPLSTYFSAFKMRWLIDNVPAVRDAIAADDCCFGTIDAWLLTNLCGTHATDVTNASRTMLMDLSTLQWSDELLDLFGVPRACLPEIRASDADFGRLTVGPLHDVPMRGCLGDQQAATVGQLCFQPGDVKSTYGTGCFIVMNTGTKPVPSKSGLLTTVAYQLNGQPACYGLEGSVAIAGAGLKWLQDNLGLISEPGQAATLASEVEDTGGVYFVPAFSGLFAPHWRPDARGVIVGLTQFSHRGHIARALLEAVCLQTREVIEVMRDDLSASAVGATLDSLHVDGGMSRNDFIMQLQADVAGVAVVRPSNIETTSIGAAVAAGLGVGVWDSLEQVVSELGVTTTEFAPTWPQERRDAALRGWHKAVQRSFDLA